MTADQKRYFNRRLAALKFFLVIFACIILLKLFVVSVAQHGYYKALAENQHEYFQHLLPNRGEILISDKFVQKPYPVATNSSKDMVYALLKEVADLDATAAGLAPILGMEQKELLSKLSEAEKKYVPLMHALSEEQSSQIKSLKLPGIYLEKESIRYYPEGDFLSHVLGFIGFKDNSNRKAGLYGLEKYYEKALAGSPGSLYTEADFKGNWITGSKRDFVPAKDGLSIYLTIDRAIQHKAEKVIAESVRLHQADSGTVIIANPKTGAILAMANYPSFDLNAFNKVQDPKVFLNSATVQNYEPGSTMKAITMAIGLDMRLVTPDTTYNDTGEVEVDRYKIQNSDKKAYGQVNMREVINHSLNTGAIFVERLIGSQQFLNYLQKFRFGKATDIELPEAIGDLSNLKLNIQVNYDTASFGQGITATPMQMIQSYMALANGGKMMRPYIVDSEIGHDGRVKKTQPVEVAQVISENAASTISAMLVDDVENGYGKKAAVKGYYIGGKTGTAQVVAKGKYVENTNIGSFIGYGPLENPQFVMLVNINHPRDVKFAESTAVPAFWQIAQFILDYYQIPPTRK